MAEIMEGAYRIENAYMSCEPKDPIYVLSSRPNHHDPTGLEMICEPVTYVMNQKWSIRKSEDSYEFHGVNAALGEFTLGVDMTGESGVYLTGYGTTTPFKLQAVDGTRDTYQIYTDSISDTDGKLALTVSNFVQYRNRVTLEPITNDDTQHWHFILLDHNKLI